MLTLRPSAERGHADHGWLQTFHSFSFADYHDPRHMGWGNLRVINDDRVAPGTGFGRHGHRDMEIVTYVLAGALTHQDSMGNRSTIGPGEVQRMSAGTGVLHSEYNHGTQAVHLLQIWLLPRATGLPTGYQQHVYTDADKRGRLRLIASPDGAENSLSMQTDARLYAGLFDGPESAEMALPPGRKAYVHLARGSLSVNGLALQAGDAARIADETRLVLSHGSGAEVLVFDLAP